MLLRILNKCTKFRGVELSYPAEVFVCPICNLEAGTIEQASAIQKAIADAYRKKKGLLTGDEIRRYRKENRLTRQELAVIMGADRIRIEEWEEGLIQSEHADKALRSCLIRKFPTPKTETKLIHLQV